MTDHGVRNIVSPDEAVKFICTLTTSSNTSSQIEPRTDNGIGAESESREQEPKSVRCAVKETNLPAFRHSLIIVDERVGCKSSVWRQEAF